MKRVLKGASSLSVYSHTRSETISFSLGNDPHCACDLRVSGPNDLGAEITITPGASESLIRIAEAVVQASFGPVAFRVCWGDTEPSDLLLTKTAEPTNVDPGESLSYTITLRNAGPSDAQNVSVTDVLPASTLFLSMFAPPEYSCVTPTAFTTGTVTCTRAVLPPSATADTFQLNVQVSTAAMPGPLTNTVTATSATADPSPENTATAALAIGAAIPTLSTAMMWLFAALLGVVALRVIR